MEIHSNPIVLIITYCTYHTLVYPFIEFDDAKCYAVVPIAGNTGTPNNIRKYSQRYIYFSFYATQSANDLDEYFAISFLRGV